MLVERVGELLARPVEVLAELVRLQHQRVPLVVERLEEARGCWRWTPASARRGVGLDLQEVIQRQGLLRHGALARRLFVRFVRVGGTNDGERAGGV